MADLLEPEICGPRLELVCEYHNFVLEKYYKQRPVDVQALISQCIDYGEMFKDLIIDVPRRLQGMTKEGGVVFEGAQGTMLDIHHGTYPFVTSSNTTAGAASVGSGVSPLDLGSILGVAKAYSTRVGGGPFPTELNDQNGERMAEEGREFGATTGRPRRCGWFDAVGVKQACKINGITSLCITKLDVLDSFSEIKICTAYECDGKIFDVAPTQVTQLWECKPIYESFSGWGQPTSGCRQWDKLPAEAVRYLNRISELIDVPIDMVSTGADRNDTIVARHPLDEIALSGP